VRDDSHSYSWGLILISDGGMSIVFLLSSS